MASGHWPSCLGHLPSPPFSSPSAVQVAISSNLGASRNSLACLQPHLSPVCSAFDHQVTLLKSQPVAHYSCLHAIRKSGDLVRSFINSVPQPDRSACPPLSGHTESTGCPRTALGLRQAGVSMGLCVIEPGCCRRPLSVPKLLLLLFMQTLLLNVPRPVPLPVSSSKMYRHSAHLDKWQGLNKPIQMTHLEE